MFVCLHKHNRNIIFKNNNNQKPGADLGLVKLVEMTNFFFQ